MFRIFILMAVCLHVLAPEFLVLNKAFSQQLENQKTYELEGAGGFKTEEIQSPKSKDGVAFSEAYLEEINSKNYPDVLDTFDYPDVDIKDLVSVMSELTGKRFILSDKVSGKISIIAPGPITVAEAYKAFLSALQMNNLTVVPSGKFLKIIGTRDAIKDSIETYTGDYFPDADQMITKIIKLKYIPVGELDKSLRNLRSKDGDLQLYEPTNSIIISDYGSNVEKILGIIGELDVPGFEEKMQVIKIKYAQAKDIAELINKIINKGDDNSKVPRFRRRESDKEAKGAVSLSYVTADDRTNSVIVLGNKRGITKAKELVKTLDFRLEGDEQGGVFVYYAKYNNAEEIAKTLGGIADESKKAQDESQKKSGVSQAAAVSASDVAPKTAGQVFGSQVSVQADKNTNSIVVTASAQDYQRVLSILEKIDIPRDQVFVETVIMELNARNNRDVGLDIGQVNTPGEATQSNPAQSFAPQGFFGNENGIVNLLTNPASLLAGGILSFGFGEEKYVQVPGATGAGGVVAINSVIGLVRLIQQYDIGNVLSTPKVTALDNEEAIIEIGQDISIGQTLNQTPGQNTISSPLRQKIKTALEITPSISPATNSVRLKIKQTINDVPNRSSPNPDINEKLLQTNLVVPDGDTAVLGGLVNEQTSKSVTKIPLLGDIPILGWLFRSTGKTVDKTNLMLFITPKILRNPAHQKALLKDQMDKRLKFVKKNMKGVDPHGEAADEISKGFEDFEGNNPKTEDDEFNDSDSAFEDEEDEAFGDDDFADTGFDDDDEDFSEDSEEFTDASGDFDDAGFDDDDDIELEGDDTWLDETPIELKESPAVESE